MAGDQTLIGKKWIDVLWSYLANIRKNNIYYVTDSANWSFYWDAYYITKGLRDRLGLKAHVIQNPWRLKGQLIHFGDRYSYLNGPYSDIQPSNRVFLTWFHGGPDDPDPYIQKLCGILPHASQFLEKIVVPCKITKEVLISLGIKEDKIESIALGVDLEMFHALENNHQKSMIRKNLGIPDDAICIGSFQKDGAGWGDGFIPKNIKGPDIFLGVIKQLSGHFGNLFVLLTGPARGYVKQGLEKLGIPYVHKYLDNYLEIVMCYQALDLYIITSRAEGGPKALLESWATGIPVGSTRVGMPADLIVHGRNGMLADIDDVDGLTNSAVEIITNPRLRDNCKENAIRDVRQYDWEIIAEQYFEKLYKPFLGDLNW